MNKKQTLKVKLMNSLKGGRLLVLFLSLMVLFGILGWNVVQTYEKIEQTGLQPTIIAKEVEKEKIKYENNLKERNFYKSDTYIEQEGRNTLGLAFPNETLYILKKNVQTTPIPQILSEPVTTPATEHSEAMLSRWLKLIFG